MTFRDATSVRRTGDDTWDTQFAENWDIMDNTNGGYMLAIASRAASEATGGRDPVTITGHYTKPGHTGPATARTDVVRSGRRFSVVRTSLFQDDAVVLDTLGTFVQPGDGSSEVLLSDAKPAALPPPEECLLVFPASDGPFPPPSVGQIEQRLDPRMAGLLQGRPLGEPVVLGWMRLKDDEPLDAHALIMASDAFPPTTFNAGLPVGWTPTLELTVHIRFPEASGWIRCKKRPSSSMKPPETKRLRNSGTKTTAWSPSRDSWPWSPTDDVQPQTLIGSLGSESVNGNPDPYQKRSLRLSIAPSSHQL